mmetsp:Transcript_5924/g.10007  ORF Transcript_5924/g.10007 Transcript_5924/m.10007 type:complete len:226 (+) Transcript_5924:104-781(+)
MRFHSQLTVPTALDEGADDLRRDGDRVHDNRGDRVVVAVGPAAADLHDNVHARSHLAEDRVLARGALVEPVEEVVVDRVDEELRAARVRLASVGHGEGTRLVRDPLRELVRNVPAPVAGDGLATRGRVASATRRAAGASVACFRVLRLGAAELQHEVGDHAVEGQAVVEARVGKVNEVRPSDWHRVNVDLGREGALRGVEGRSGISRSGSHGCYLSLQLSGRGEI